MQSYCCTCRVFHEHAIRVRRDTIVTFDGLRCVMSAEYATLGLMEIDQHHWGQTALPLTGHGDSIPSAETESRNRWAARQKLMGWNAEYLRLIDDDVQCMVHTTPAGACVEIKRPDTAVFGPRISLVIDTNLRAPLHAILVVGVAHTVRVACLADLALGQGSTDFDLAVR